jgi:hypothetical protein
MRPLSRDEPSGDARRVMRLLPAAAERKTAVAALRSVGACSSTSRGKQLPDCVKEIDATAWAQFFVKFLLENEHLTADRQLSRPFPPGGSANYGKPEPAG